MIHDAILQRYRELDPHHRQKSQFGTKQFWEVDPMQINLMEEDTIPDGFQLVDEWKEGDE